jgi:hypothetical protein
MLLTFTGEAVMSTAERTYDYPQYRWHGPRFHPLWIVATILGFIFWWPVGLAILAFMIWSRNMGCHGGDRWQRKMQRMDEKMGRMRDKMERFGNWQGSWGGPPSSGNNAFDEYRTETLRRLEEEQREFRDFLDRLRFAKDKAEFDEFMAERRNRPSPQPPQAPQPQS